MHQSPHGFVNPLAAFLLTGLLAGSLTSQKGGVYSDPLLGMKIKPPSRWTYLGKIGDRGALRILYASSRSYASKAQRGVSHIPTMRVLWFPKPKDGAKKPDEKSKWPMLSPYSSVKDYMERVYVGMKQVSVEVGAIGKMQGRRYVTAGNGNGGQKLTLHIASVSLDDGEFAIEYECLTEQHKKLKSQFEKSLLTLTPMTRKPPAELELPMWESDREGWLKKDAKTRATEREAWGKQWLRTRKAVPETGWKTHTTDGYLILSHADSKFSKRIVKATQIIRKWVDGWIGETTDETVMPAVIRIFADRRERTAYQFRDINPREYDPRVRELYFFKDASVGNTGAGFAALTRGIFEHVLHDKHPYAKRDMPRWLDNGLWGYMDSYKLKGRNLAFVPGKIETGRFAYHKQHDNRDLQPIWGMIQERSARGPEDGANEPNWGYTPECTRILRWLDKGGSEFFFKSKRFLPTYLKQVGDSAVTASPAIGRLVDQRRLNAGQLKELNKLIYKRRDALVDTIGYAVIPISIDAWKKADAAFRVYNENFKL
ncbi:MAG: hypothetical protein VX951_08035 [Planctomycetota bacterium]|nr:hypothetical protein [Planctomycetota bacterium]